MSTTHPATDTEAVLRRIRGLLDQAENTPYPDEAETFAAKAAELMARHRVDRAVLDRQRRDRGGGIVEVDVELGRGQYVRARLALLGGVADAFDCRLLTSSRPEGRTGHVIGQRDDVDQVTMLYTSLLVQATRAAAVEPVPRGHAGVSFRRGFLLGFAQRVGDRLADQMARVVERAPRPTGHGAPTVAVVLADRRSQIDAWVAERYGRLGRLDRAAPVLLEAARRGEAAGDRADLGDRHLGEQPRSLPA